jgi:hypothetical protein
MTQKTTPDAATKIERFITEPISRRDWPEPAIKWRIHPPIDPMSHNVR